MTNDVDYFRHLQTAFARLFRVYEQKIVPFDVTVTATAILQGDDDHRFSIWHGLDYSGKRHFAMSPVFQVTYPGDVADIDTDWDIDTFADIFAATMPDSRVSVYDLVSLVFIITRHLDDWHLEQTCGQHLVQLY